MKLLRLLALSSSFATAAAAASGQGFPPPGEYRIEEETATATLKSPAIDVQKEMKTDVKTGTLTVTDSDSLGARATKNYQGEAPKTRCIGGPESFVASRVPGSTCTTNFVNQSEKGSSMSVDCNGSHIESEWAKVDGKTWKLTLKTQPGVSTSSAGARAAIDAVTPTMTPEERAKAIAYREKLPTQSRIDEAMAPIIAKLEEAAKNGSPQDAELARQQLAMLRAQRSPGGAPSGLAYASRQTWTRVSETCSSAAPR